MSSSSRFLHRLQEQDVGPGRGRRVTQAAASLQQAVPYSLLDAIRGGFRKSRLRAVGRVYAVTRENNYLGNIQCLLDALTIGGWHKRQDQPCISPRRQNIARPLPSEFSRLRVKSLRFR